MLGAPQTQLLIINALHLVPAVIKVVPRVQVIDNVQVFAAEYKDDLPIPQNLRAELHCWLTRWEAETDCDVPKDAAAPLKAVDNAFFPNIHTCLKLVCTFGVTSAERERTISVLRRLETYMRSTMTEDRINGLAMLHVYYGVEVDIDAIINQFVRLHPRRMLRWT